MDILKSHGHEVHIAISEKHSKFLQQLGIQHHILPDIQETDQGGFPSFKWFSNIETITRCIREEVALIEKIQPDRVLGVFRFTLYASAKIAQIPYDSLICGCMIPDCNEVLGFSENDPGIELQRQFLANFFRFAGMKTSQALVKLGLRPIDDIRWALKGERTFLWDFPEFMPLQNQSQTIHIGPMSLYHGPYDPVNLDAILDTKSPIAVVSFGTCVSNHSIVHRIVQLLLDMDYKVIVAAGGQKEMLDIQPSNPKVTVINFAPLTRIFPHTSLLVTHGGQMTIFEALQNEVPIIVMPFQPEQAHNGVCLERIGCGQRLIPSTHFTGEMEDYIQVFQQISDVDMKTKINTLIHNPKTKENLAKIKKFMEKYQGTNTLVNYIEGHP
jgi:UDP:flavonoid glycosyltransferase YjiC (YdhE family)